MFFISVKDFIYLPLYIGIGFVLMHFYHKKSWENDKRLRSYFYSGLTIKIIGCVAIGCIYEYYYRGAFDGRFYFEGGKMLTAYWKNHPGEFLPVLFSDMNHFNSTNFDHLLTYNVQLYADESFFVAKIAGIFNLLSDNLFLPCSLFFCFISFIALWNLFLFIIKEYKLPVRYAALCTLFMPSIIIWSSSIFKDTIMLICLCWLFICSFYLIIKPTKIFKNSLGFIAAFIILTQVKVYILAIFIPFFILYGFNTYKSKISNESVRVLSTPFIYGIGLAAIFLFFSNAEGFLGRYSYDKVLNAALQTSFQIGFLQAGSTYNIKVDFSSFWNIIKTFFSGVNVTLFRPYPWEFLKPLTIIASIESMIFFILTVLVIVKTGLFTFFKTVAKVPILQFCFGFSIVFAFMIGISSQNFGTLVRYKIPILPFYGFLIASFFQFNKYKSQKSIIIKRKAGYSHAKEE